ncbi:MAG: urea transporter [Ignavibacteria bacterium]|nr:urea transporter [Ignavibacteria bacterium]
MSLSIIIIDSVLFSYSQIFFSNRRWFGLLVLLATFISPVHGSIILFSNLITNIIALLLKYEQKKIREGFYGFNGLLLGGAISFFYKPNEYFFPILLIFLIINFFINAAIENYFAFAFNLPGLSFPFLLSFYLFAIFNSALHLFDFNTEMFFQSTFHLISVSTEINLFLQNLGFLVLQNSIISGLIVLIAILFFSRIMFLLSIVGYLFALFYLHFFRIPIDSQLGILISLNSIIVSIALGGSLIIPSNRSFVLSFLGVSVVTIFTIVLSTLLQKVNLSVFVLPFNFTVFLIIYALKFRESSGEVVLLYFKPGSPEENYYYHKNQKARFEKYKFINVGLPFNGEWTVSQGFDGEFTHKEDWRYAFDFVVTDEKGKTYDNTGTKLEDYHCYGLPVCATYKGKVIKVIDGIDENEVGKVNIKQNWGNTVIIDHGQGLFSAVSHLKKNTIRVKEGDEVEKGDVLGNCGNSGRSPEPHIHFQFQKNDKLGAATIKFPFGHYLVNRGEFLELKSYDYPLKDEKIQKLEINSKIKQAFNFEYGDKFEVQFKKDEKVVKEIWEVKVDPYNIPYIEASTGSYATFFADEEVFYFTSYVGKKKDALYHFYLAAIQIPFTSMNKVRWNDTYPISIFTNKLIMILSDALILIYNPFKAEGNFTISEEENGDYLFLNRIEFFGNGIFSSINWSRDYKVIVDKNGFLKSFYFIDRKNIKNEFTFIMEEER